MIIKFNRKYSFYSIYLVLFSILLISNIASAEVEINATLEDNIVILLDYSFSTTPFREYIQSNAIYSIQNIEPDSNVSVIVYGGFIKNSNLYHMDSLENRTILEEFVHNVKGKEGDVAKDNIYEGFDDARKTLYNSTGTKQIALISDGNLDGKSNVKLNNDALIELVKELKNNVTINLYQVLDTNVSPTLKTASLREPYKDFSNQLSTEVEILNPDEKIRFLKVKSNTAIVSAASEVVDSSQEDSNNNVDIISDGDEYINEFSNNGETSSVISVMYYDRRNSFHSFSEVHFYSYCNQTCTIIPFDIEQKKSFDEKTLEDVFKSKNAIELVKSNKVIESAYQFSLEDDYLCKYYGFDEVKEESLNLGGEVASLVKPENAKALKQLKAVGALSKFNPTAFVVSISCTEVLNEESKVLNKIKEGRKYTINLRNGFAYYGIVDDFQNYNRETKQRIIEAKNSKLIKIHAPIQSISTQIISPFIKIIENCLNNKCQGDILIGKTNMEIFDEKLSLINSNYAQLSNQNYESEVELAISRFNDKSEQSNTHINNAANELNYLDSQIPFSIIEIISNYLKEPEVNYSIARTKQINATYFLNAAEENNEASKFNSAIKNTEYSIVHSNEGIKLADIEKSKNRDFKNWVKVFGVIVAVLLILSIGERFHNKN